MHNTKILNLKKEYEFAINVAAEYIKKGGLVVFPTETVYGLGADAFNETAVKNIFAAKGRPADNPLIVHVASKDSIKKISKDVSKTAMDLMDAFWPGPFTAVLNSAKVLPGIVTGGLDTVAVRIPNSKAALDIIKKSETFIAAPSANLSGRPSPTKAEHVISDLMGRVDIILDGGDCRVGLESTVCDLTKDVPVILRPGGITPEMIKNIVGEVKLSEAIMKKPKEGDKILSPGVKYKHYSPKAKVYVVTGKSTKDIALKINSRYDIDDYNGLNPVIICLKKDAYLYNGKRIYDMGENVGDAARRLFDTLRKADRDLAQVVYFSALESEGIGLAIMNRVVRAAEFNII